MHIHEGGPTPAAAAPSGGRSQGKPRPLPLRLPPQPPPLGALMVSAGSCKPAEPFLPPGAGGEDEPERHPGAPLRWRVGDTGLGPPALLLPSRASRSGTRGACRPAAPPRPYRYTRKRRRWVLPTSLGCAGPARCWWRPRPGSALPGWLCALRPRPGGASAALGLAASLRRCLPGPAPCVAFCYGHHARGTWVLEEREWRFHL